MTNIAYLNMPILWCICCSCGPIPAARPRKPIIVNSRTTRAAYAANALRNKPCECVCVVTRRQHFEHHTHQPCIHSVDGDERTVWQTIHTLWIGYGSVVHAVLCNVTCCYDRHRKANLNLMFKHDENYWIWRDSERLLTRWVMPVKRKNPSTLGVFGFTLNKIV